MVWDTAAGVAFGDSQPLQLTVTGRSTRAGKVFAHAETFEVEHAEPAVETRESLPGWVMAVIFAGSLMAMALLVSLVLIARDALARRQDGDGLTWKLHTLANKENEKAVVELELS